MAKSRLGKGLGALFPDLPGDNIHEPKATEPRTSVTGVPAVATQSAATIPAQAQVERDNTSASTRTTAAANAVKAADTKASDEAQSRDTKSGKRGQRGQSRKGISRETLKSISSKRAVMPGLDAIAHPSDLFFGSEEKPTEQSPIEPEQLEENELKPVEGGYLAQIPVDRIGPNVHQPRAIFDEDDLRELADSILEVGVLQPVVVRRRPISQIEAYRAQVASGNAEQRDNGEYDRFDSEFELIMGERRWRATQLAGLDTIPAIVKTTADDVMLRDALLENLHRVALNPLEEAAAYQQMIQEFGLTQAQLSKSVSKSRPQIANTLRLLNLPASVQKKVAAGVLSAGHARALLSLADAQEMEDLVNRIIAEGLSVRSTEEIVAMKVAQGEHKKRPRANASNPWAGSPLQQHLEHRFDTKVSIKGNENHGRIEIVFSSPEDMNRILSMLIPEQPESEGEWR